MFWVHHGVCSINRPAPPPSYLGFIFHKSSCLTFDPPLVCFYNRLCVCACVACICPTNRTPPPFIFSLNHRTNTLGLVCVCFCIHMYLNSQPSSLTFDPTPVCFYNRVYVCVCISMCVLPGTVSPPPLSL